MHAVQRAHTLSQRQTLNRTREVRLRVVWLGGRFVKAHTHARHITAVCVPLVPGRGSDPPGSLFLGSCAISSTRQWASLPSFTRIFFPSSGISFCLISGCLRLI